MLFFFVFFFKQKTAYEMRISDWSSDVCSSGLEAIGGDAVEVTSIVSSASQDPHSFEPSAQDQLAVSRAELVLENGGGYDGYIDALIEASGTAAHVLTDAKYSHDWPQKRGPSAG